jgi:23S rRNA (pseudouridine1915-N3)-methyltransferase
LRLHILFVGRPKDPHANALAEEYVARICRYVPCAMREIRPEREDPWQKYPPAAKALCDPAGKALDSDAFARWLERTGRDVVFIVGGHDGLPQGWAARADLLLSLSPMTFPHELARVMLAEQIYRAFAILRGHPYVR